MKHLGKIYCITNLITKKNYIGQTIQRVGEVVGLSNVAVNNWLRKYGIERRLPHNWSSKMPLPTVM